MAIKHVTTAKPKIGGAVKRAPLGTVLPTDATTNLNEAFKSLGYCSDEGVTNANTSDTNDIKAWGGDTVYTTETDKKDTFKFTLIEALNIDVLKSVFGEDNVTGDLTSGLSIKANSKELEPCSWIIDIVLRGNTLKRMVIPNGKISEVGEVKYTEGDPIGYEVTITALPDEEGNTHYEYIKGK